MVRITPPPEKIRKKQTAPSFFWLLGGLDTPYDKKKKRWGSETPASMGKNQKSLRKT